jgi:hypothetical protein
VVKWLGHTGVSGVAHTSNVQAEPNRLNTLGGVPYSSVSLPWGLRCQDRRGSRSNQYKQVSQP